MPTSEHAGIGVFRDEALRPYVFEAVRQVRRWLLVVHLVLPPAHHTTPLPLLVNRISSPPPPGGLRYEDWGGGGARST